MTAHKHLLPAIVAAAVLLTAGTPRAGSKNGRFDFDKASSWDATLKESIELSIPGKPGMAVSLVHSFGDIIVRQGGNDAIRITGEKRVTAHDDELAQEFLDRMELRVSDRSGRIVIETSYPTEEMSKSDRKRIKNFGISYSIDVPENVILSVRNEFGDIDMEGVSGEMTVVNGFGKVNARNLTGPVELSNRFGATNAVELTGDARIRSEHGALNIRSVRGDLIAQTSFGKIEVDDVRGTARINNSHSSITARNITDSVDIETSFSSIMCSNIGGSAVLRNSHGQVRADTIGGDTDISTKFGGVSVNTVRGSLSVENEHASVQAENILGDITIRNSFGPVNISRIGGNVEVINQHSSITASEILPPKGTERRRVVCKTTFGGIKLRLPESLSSEIRVSSSETSFKSDFPIAVELKGTIGSGSRISNFKGVIDSGRDVIELDTSNGSITMEKTANVLWDWIDNLTAVHTFHTSGE